MAMAGTRAISAGTLLEAAMVAESRGAGGAGDIDDLIASFGIEVASFTASQVTLARSAFRRFGKGRHPAWLNFGDCMVYALARERGLPVLFKGNDFSQTDIEVASC